MRVRFTTKNGAYHEGADPVLDDVEAARLIALGVCEPFDKPVVVVPEPVVEPVVEEPAEVEPEPTPEPAPEPAPEPVEPKHRSNRKR